MTTYDLYMSKVNIAMSLGHSRSEILCELQDEIGGIRATLTRKLLELSGNRNPYPAREAKRAAAECVKVLNRICDELTTKERV